MSEHEALIARMTSPQHQAQLARYHAFAGPRERAWRTRMKQLVIERGWTPRFFEGTNCPYVLIPGNSRYQYVLAYGLQNYGGLDGMSHLPCEKMPGFAWVRCYVVEEEDGEENIVDSINVWDVKDDRPAPFEPELFAVLMTEVIAWHQQTLSSAQGG